MCNNNSDMGLNRPVIGVFGAAIYKGTLFYGDNFFLCKVKLMGRLQSGHEDRPDLLIAMLASR